MDDEDRALFRLAMRGVRRLKAETRQFAAHPRPHPRASFARADRRAVLQESIGPSSPLAPVDASGDALHHRARVVRVIHGKGLRSGHRGPVLKLVASSYLQRVGAVLGFASAREVDGGSGAILVLLGTAKRPHR
jgi:DNA-nicking Smr family endonuclease